MKLFFQLDEKTQNEVLHHCANIVMQDMIEDGVKIDPITDEEIALKDKLEEAVLFIKTLPTREEKMNYLLGDDEISRAVYDIGLEMAKSAFYHDTSELVIYPDSLRGEDFPEENLLPEYSPKSKKISPLN